MSDAIVLDSSAIIAGLYGERGASSVMELLETDPLRVLISTVNLCEVVTKLAQSGAASGDIDESISPFKRFLVEFDLSHALRAGELARETKEIGLSLGGRACLALAASRDATAWITDSVWKKVSPAIKVHLIRVRSN